MNLGELKASFAKLPSDMDKMEVMVAYAINGKREYELVCFTGFVPLENGFVVVGALSETQRMVETGQITKPEGYISPEEYKKFMEELPPEENSEL